MGLHTVLMMFMALFAACSVTSSLRINSGDQSQQLPALPEVDDSYLQAEPAGRRPSWWRPRELTSDISDDENADADIQDLTVVESSENEEPLPEDDNFAVPPGLQEMDGESGLSRRGIVWRWIRRIRFIIKVVRKIIKNRNDDDRRTLRELTEETETVYDTAEIFASETETRLYAAKLDADDFMKSQVAEVQLVTRPLDRRVTRNIWTALGGKQYAVIATLFDGRRFMLVKGNDKGQGRRTVIIPHDHVTDDWTKEYNVQLKTRELGHLVFAGGDKFHPLDDNGRHAAQRIINIQDN